ncbi:glycosyltransferase [Cyanobacterium stanieri LEGE 03274]|uniref:Glycosyltransferase n=1 Tax=Cyanobacterium stanieri LEGE 03274 TaxID=1828756 RepID=A0ABR9V2P1_9CHRO|nr:glycosyltransferase family 4 protein [Cyanobacterium stanieri]MBE9222168.1 glycosyltransferase [Cyanobacterium stanieri LEGE 03274]
MKILIISNTFPYPQTKGGTHCRNFNLIDYLRKHHQVTLITQQTPDVKPEEVNELKEIVQELVIFPSKPPSKTSIFNKIKRFTDFIIQGKPPSVMANYLPEIQQWIDDAVSKNKFDLIAGEHTVNEIYIRPEWKNKISTLIDIHSSVYRTCQDQLATKTSENPWRDRLNKPLLYRYEKNYCQKFSKIIVTTKEDKATINQLSHRKDIEIIPNGVNLDMFPCRENTITEHTLMIAGGMDYIVNADGACFFGLEVFPLIQEKYPRAKLLIVGSKPTQAVQSLSKNNSIIVTGRVPSMVDYLHQTTISVVPLRSGFGMKIKTLEAMAAGIPVVASDRGLEGLTVDNPLCALRANTIDEYVKQISKLFDNSDLRQEIAYNARKMIENHYTWEKAAMGYEKIITGE